MVFSEKLLFLRPDCCLCFFFAREMQFSRLRFFQKIFRFLLYAMSMVYCLFQSKSVSKQKRFD